MAWSQPAKALTAPSNESVNPHKKTLLIMGLFNDRTIKSAAKNEDL